ncbi:MAG: flagellar basal body P-ring formation chaperone FlgA [Pseudomonadota bacterium]
MRNYWKKMPITRRITLALLTYAVIIIAAISTTKQVMAASLRNVSVVTTDVIMLKDLFDGVRRNADYVIGPAPQPGEDLVLNARTLYRIAIAMDLPWRPKSTADNIIVRRDATIVSYSDIENTLKKELGKNGLNGRYNLSLDNGNKSIVLAKDLPRSVQVSQLYYDSINDRFQATLVAPSIDNPIKKIPVTGSVQRMVSVPVLREPMRSGMIIGKNDIELIDMPEKELQHNTLFKTEDLIGLTPRRIAYAGKPLQTKELQRPQIVTRGERVTIYFKEGPLMLTAKGKALENGAKGDVVRISNLGSSKNLDAVVINQNEVVVQ